MKRHARPQPAPGGPRGVPVLGSLPAFGRDQLGFLQSTAREHGDLVYYNLAGRPTIQLCGSDDIEQVLVKNHRNFVKNQMIWRHFTAVFGQGLLTAEGAAWQSNRKLAAPAFAGNQLLGYGPDMVSFTRQAVDRWRPGDVLDIHHEMMGLTLRIAAKTLMDSEIEQDITDMDRVVTDLINEFAVRVKRPVLIPDWVPLPGHIRYRRAIATAERVIARMIAERRANGFAGRSDFLSRFMGAHNGDGVAMSDRQLRDETLTMLLAGHETTALALSWTFHLIGQDAEVQERLAAELDSVLAGREPSTDDLANLPFTEAVINEAMRLYPPAWVIGRESVEAFELRGHRFAPGTMVLIAPWVLHRHPAYYDAPELFRPERWLDGLARQLPRFAFMPFGGGPRICVGQRFAMIEAMLLLATIAQRYSVEWQRERPITPFPSITLRPNGGVWVRLQAR